VFMIIPLFGCINLCFGQQKWEEYVLQLAEESEDEVQMVNLYEDLSFLSQHPVNLNGLISDKLQILPFLSETQIENLNKYIVRYGPLKTIYELRLVPDLDLETIELLLPFVYVGESEKEIRKPALKDVLKYGKNEAIVRFDKCLNEKQGYADISEEELLKYPNRRYLGEPFYTSFRYEFRYRDKISLGITGEKDAGEMFWKEKHKGHDYYSTHLLLRDFGKVKTLALGDYRVSFGQGLILNSDFKLGKSSRISNTGKRSQDIKRHFSTDEFNYFRGIAASLKFNRLTTTFFYSYKKIDANIDTGTQTILSIKKDGLHRTQNESDKKNAARQQTSGMNMSLSRGRFSGGISALYYDFDKFVNPEERPYNLFYFRGKSNTNLSVDYRYKMPGFIFFGETAVCQNRALATLDGIVLEPASYCRLLMIYRYYDKQYRAFFGNAFSEGSSVQNESGFYAGLEIIPLARWKITGYVDFFRFPWLKYGIDAPSDGFDGLIQINYSFKHNKEMFLRYRYKNKTENISSRFLDNTIHTHPVDDVLTHRLRYQFTYSVSSSLKGKSIVDYNLYYPAGTQNGSKGFLISQDMGWNPEKLPITADLQLSWFQTDDYDSRVYSYEKNVPYSFSVPSFYGEGLRLVFNMRCAFRKNVSLYLRFTQTRYFSRDTIGSGLETINGNVKSDISCLVKWRF